jgi:DNA-binding beta-propeller fold protein YncE
MTRRKSARAASIVVTLALAGCPAPSATDDATAIDAQAGDAGSDDASLDAAAGLIVTIGAPTIGYLDEETCVDLWVSRPTARVSVLWGDGARTDDAGARACHVYAAPGTVRLGAIAEDDGLRAEATRTLLVVPRPSDPRPTASATIAYDGAHDRVWVVNPDHDTVAVLRVAGSTISLERELAACDHPRTLSTDGARVLVACQDSSEIAAFDAASLAWITTFPVDRSIPGVRPFGVVHDPRGGYAYVALQDTGEIAIIDRFLVPIGRLAVGPDLRNVAVNADGDLLVTAWRGSSEGAAVHLVDVRDPLRPRLVGTTTLAVQTGLDSDTDNDGVPSFLSQVVFSPDGTHALIPALKANVVAGLARTGLPLTSQTTARGILVELALGAVGAPAIEVARFPFDDLDAASAVVFSPEGARTYTALRGSGSIVANDPFSFDMVGSIGDAGITPEGLALSPDGRLLFVQDTLGRTVRVFDVSVMPIPTVVTEVRTAAGEPLAPDVLAGAIVFNRARDPRMSRTSYLSCASCHLDGEGDNLVWDFTQRGEGLRNTISLAGRAGTAHGPLHWSANFDEVQDFEGDIRNGQGGTGFLPDAIWASGTHMQSLGDPKAGLSVELDQLAAYVASLSRWGVSPHRRPGDAAWEARRARGEALFRDARTGCAECHAGPRFTDSTFITGRTPLLHDVGTLRPTSGQRLGGALPGLDTPTLRGLWRTAPYLHDGSAATLREVLTTRNTGDRHGTTSTLTPDELDDLEAYVLTLDDLE